MGGVGGGGGGAVARPITLALNDFEPDRLDLVPGEESPVDRVGHRVEDEIGRAPLENGHPSLCGELALGNEIALGHVARLPRRCRPEELDEELHPSEVRLDRLAEVGAALRIDVGGEDRHVELRQVADHLVAMVFEVLGDLRHQHRPGSAVGHRRGRRNRRLPLLHGSFGRDRGGRREGRRRVGGAGRRLGAAVGHRHELAADLLGDGLKTEIVERRVEPRRQRQRDVGLALVALPEVDAEIVVERVRVAIARIERQALEREEPRRVVGHRDEGRELVPRPLAVDVARRAHGEEDGALPHAVENLVERVVALEPAGVEIDGDLVAAAEALLQRDAKVLLELLDPRVAERVHLVVGVGVADEHIVFETMHEGHGQSD